MRFVGVVVPDGLQGTVRGAADEGVRAVLVGIVPGIELVLCHVRRIETGAGKRIGITFHEGFTGGAVPWAVVDFGEGLLDRVCDAVQEDLLVAEVLFPVDSVHLVGGEAVEIQHLLAVVGDAAEVGSFNGYHGVICYAAGKRGLGFIAGDHRCQCEGGQD